MTRSIRTLILLGLLQALAACAATPVDNRPTEYLDEKSAATVTVVRHPLVLARERRELAANTRDYVTVAAAAVNRSGKITYVLIVYVWSTVDVRGAARAAAPDTLVLAADDRRIRFTWPARALRTRASQFQCTRRRVRTRSRPFTPPILRRCAS